MSKTGNFKNQRFILYGNIVSVIITIRILTFKLYPYLIILVNNWY